MRGLEGLFAVDNSMFPAVGHADPALMAASNTVSLSDVAAHG